MPAASYPFLDAPGPLAIAHRGGAAHGDENTMAAFERAVAVGYRYLETDVHATADGVAVIFHDASLRRILGQPGRIRDLPWAELAAIGQAGPAGPATVPRLDAVLAAWPQVRLNIDMKSNAVVMPTIAAVRAAGAVDRVLLASFADHRIATARAELGPRLATSLGRAGVARVWLASRRWSGQPIWRGRPARWLAQAAATTAAPAAAVQVPVRLSRRGPDGRRGPGVPVCDARLIGYAHHLGLAVHVWTIDDPALMHELLDRGVDGIMTDHIDVLRDVYTTRGIWAERAEGPG